MYDSFIKYIEAYSGETLSEENIALIKEVIKEKKLRKRQFLLQDGDICNFMGFIVKGSMRQYIVDDKGTEHITGLMVENWWTGDRESFFRNTPSIYNIDAWEETDLLLLPKNNFEQINTQSWFIKMRLKMDENHFISSEKRILSSLSQTADHRYEELKNENPEFLQRFPQHLIASYLGITKETLSRVRNKSVKRS